MITQPVDQRHSSITAVSITVGDQSSVVSVPPPDQNGRSTISFAAAAASSLSLTIDGIEPRTTVDRRYAETTVLPAAISEIEAPSIAAAIPLAPAPFCRTDLVTLDGRPSQSRSAPRPPASCSRAGRDGSGLRRRGAECGCRYTSPDNNTRRDHGDRREQGRPARCCGTPCPVAGTASRQRARTRTTRTATVTNCPIGCWLILGEGFNDGWQAEQGSTDLGPPRQISGGFNGWWLPGSDSPVVVTMTWTPQRTMWIGMFLALLAVLACAVLICRDRARSEATVLDAPVPDWPSHPVGRRQAVIAAVALVALHV